MSKIHHYWRNANPALVRQLEREDPEHLEQMAAGWSWIELMGGPKDGQRHYFVGAPQWRLSVVDPSVDPATYRPGDLEHLYELAPGPAGIAVFQWRGAFRREMA